MTNFLMLMDRFFRTEEMVRLEAYLISPLPHKETQSWDICWFRPNAYCASVGGLRVSELDVYVRADEI